MSDFEKWQSRYEKGWVTKEQLQRLVMLSVLNDQEYETITGERFPG